MINIYEVVETNNMIEKENLDVRTITLGISLLDCIDADLSKLREKIHKKIYDAAKIYNFKSLENDIRKVRNMNFQADRDLYSLNRKFLDYLKRSI